MRLLLLLTTLSIILPHLPSTASEDLKASALRYQTQIMQASPGERGELYKGLALVYYRDQNQERAFQSYLQALDAAVVVPMVPMSDNERRLYDEALGIYLNHAGNNPTAVAEEILKKYQPVVVEHGDYYALGYIMAAAYANLEMFPEFFDRFYISFCHLPVHYLAYKTKAVLHAKLFSRARTDKEREVQRRGIIDNLEKAISYYPTDAGMYKMLLATTGDDQKGQVLKTYLKKIINENIITPRVDILYYVQQCVANDERVLAQEFINKSREWYQYSRAVDAAQQYLNENSGKESNLVP